jgi:hypothetical protein
MLLLSISPLTQTLHMRLRPFLVGAGNSVHNDSQSYHLNIPKGYFLGEGIVSLAFNMFMNMPNLSVGAAPNLTYPATP